MKRIIIWLAGLLFAGNAFAALSALEFVKMTSSEQMDHVEPMLVSFLSAGFKEIPNNSYKLASRMREIILKKGYTFHNTEEIAKEAAMSMGMKRGF